ncbi:hypothetical protein I4Q36_09680 [Tuanshanicoccus lijuaniae]|uniref:HD domain-containing protein n=1 Tax=Aerococcaceae bacterium zg-1292 TaxID=2774330 RepID=UPI00193510DD|nr:phosphohydrolase [Aerococcaceae bacterium zg-BR22]QQA37016.1 hypothetical protein I4Q36_09680 [Aerococcaceae bacterium zg-1292]
MNHLTNSIRHKYLTENSGHAFDHLLRVAHLTQTIADASDDQNYLWILALLHEEFDDKLNHAQTHDCFIEQLHDWQVPADYFDALIRDLPTIGFKGGFTIPERSHAAQLVTDADMLDAMGAIGIARTFQYNGQVKHAPFYDPALAQITLDSLDEYRHKQRNAIAHFDEKLLRLKSFIQTDKAKAIAEKRHQRTLQFVTDFFDELAESGVDVSLRFDYKYY